MDRRPVQENQHSPAHATAHPAAPVQPHMPAQEPPHHTKSEPHTAKVKEPVTTTLTSDAGEIPRPPIPPKQSAGETPTGKLPIQYHFSPDQRQKMLVETFIAFGVPQEKIDRYMWVAEAESCGSQRLIAKTTTARGDFQITDKAWQDVRKWAAKSWPSLSEQIEKVGIDHPYTQAVAMAYLSERTDRQLRQYLKQEPNDFDRYAAHFLGFDGAKELLRIEHTPGHDPKTPMNSLMSDQAAEANPKIAAMTLKQFHAWVETKTNPAITAVEKAAGGPLLSISCVDTNDIASPVSCTTARIHPAALKYTNEFMERVEGNGLGKGDGQGR